MCIYIYTYYIYGPADISRWNKTLPCTTSSCLPRASRIHLPLSLSLIINL